MTSLAARAAALVTASPDGFTVNVRTGEVPAAGYMVAIPGHEVRADRCDDIPAIAYGLSDPIYAEPGIWLGGWQSDGRCYLEPSVNLADLGDALTLGRIWHQAAIWDVSAGREITVSVPA